MASQPYGSYAENVGKAEAGVGEIGFSEKSIRMGFIRKVYGILTVQLAVTISFIALFLFQKDVRLFSQSHQELYISALVIYLVSVIVLACCSTVRRRHPWNLIILGIFTLSLSFMVGSISSYYDAEDVIIAIGITAAITLALTAFAFQTKWDFTMWGGMLVVLLISLLFFGIFAGIFGGLYGTSRVVNIVYCSLGAILFGFFIVYDTQLMLGGNHKFALSPEEYIFAALNLYLDIVNLFLYILAMFGRK